MRITRIDFEGPNGRAIAQVSGGNILVRLELAHLPNGEEQTIPRRDEDALFSTAARMQQLLEGCRGTASDIHDYYRELQRLA